jgi:hypothetical protein
MAALAAAALAGLLLALAPVVGADTDAAGGNAGAAAWSLGTHSLRFALSMSDVVWFLQLRLWGTSTPPGTARLSSPVGRRLAAATPAAPPGWASPAQARP